MSLCLPLFLPSLGQSYTRRGVIKCKGEWRIFYYIHLFAEGGGSTHTHHGVCMEVRRQLRGVGSLFLPCESHEWISGRKSWRQAPLPSGLSEEFLFIFGRDCWTPGPCNIVLWVTGPGEAHLASRASIPHHVLLTRTLAATACGNSTRGSTAQLAKLHTDKALYAIIF